MTPSLPNARARDVQQAPRNPVIEDFEIASVSTL
jgi:hypothetical protein